MRLRPFPLPAIALAFSFLISNAHAQNYSIGWYKIAGGGGTSAGQTFSVTGTIGQHDAGTMSGGTFTLEGGFWPGIIVTSDSGAPTLFIQQSAATLTISWTPATPGFLLEETTSLVSPSWSPAPGGNPTGPISAAGQAKYYRLRRP